MSRESTDETPTASASCSNGSRSSPAWPDGGRAPPTRSDGDGGSSEPPVDAALRLSDVDSGYGEIQVLSGLSMHLRDDEVVCLIGPNGAGKSTVLRTVFGLLEPWRGTVRLRDRDVTTLTPPEMVRAGVGYVPQEANVFGSLSVTENLRMGGVAVTDVDARIAALRERFPLLVEKADARAASLSGGQRQVVAFARALMTDPDVLLIDEPSAGLAPDTAKEVLGHVARVNDAGAAVLMVEQNAEAGLAVADRGYVLDQGSVRFEGAADGLADDPAVRRLYLGG